MASLEGLMLVCAFAAGACALNSEGIPASSGPTSSSSSGGGHGSGGAGASGGGGDGPGGSACPGGGSCVPSPDDGEIILELAMTASCPEGWAARGLAYATSNVDPGCAGCACEAPTGTCTPGDVKFYDQDPCDGTAQQHSSPKDGDCLAADNGSNGQDAVIALAGTASDGSCVPVPTKPVPVDGRKVCALAAAPGRCAAGTCVPAGASGTVCVLAAGSTCPAGWPVASKLYEVLDDTRACDCQCDAGPKGACAGSVKIYESSDCSGASVVTYSSNEDCNDTSSLANNIGSVEVVAGTFTGPPCPPHPHDSGKVTFGPAKTLCCVD